MTRYILSVLVPTFALYLTLGATGLLLALVVVKYDLYQREPWWIMVITTALGAAAMTLAGDIQLAAIGMINAREALVSDWVLASLAAGSEELGKLSVVCAMAIVFRKHFDEPLDGIIYGSFAGLGAALAESVHFLGWAAAPQYLPPQEPIRLAGHLVMGGIAGYGVGMVATGLRGSVAALLGAFTGAVLLHLLWDLVAFDAADHYMLHETLRVHHTAVPVGLMVAGMFAYKKLVLIGARQTRAYLKACDAVTRQCPPE